VEVDLDHDPTAPVDADVLFWVQPAAASPAHQRQLRRFLESGRSAVLAGSAYTIDYLPAGQGQCRYRAIPQSTAWEELLRPWGLRPQPDLLLDRAAGPLSVAAGGASLQVEAPFQLRCTPAFRDMRSFAAPARGALAFVGASALELDLARVAAGYQAEVVATTSENAWVQPLPSGEFGTAELSQPRLQVGKQNLMILLKPEDPWAGQLVVLASASPFQDQILDQPGYGHQILLRDLARTLTAPQRLVRLRVERPQPPLLPPLGESARLLWRGWAVFALPLVLLGLGLRRYQAGQGRRSLPPFPAMLRPALLLTGALTLPWLAGKLGSLQLDLSADNLNTPSPLTLQLFAQHRAGLQIEAALTPPASMPPALKTVEPRVKALLDQGDLEVRWQRPADQAQRAGLQREGLRPFEVQRVVQDSLVRQLVWSGLRLEEGGRSALIPHLDQRSGGHLEFLLAAALKRLELGRAPQVAVIADWPRLSPAEALEDFQRQGLSAPSGTDVYSQLKALLQDYGYAVTYVNPQDPVVPEDTDVFLWMQPRRDSGRLLLLLGRHLARGRPAIVAMQHFNIQQRQYRGAGFQTVYWPQPQFQDLDRYLNLLGVEQVREVLMDRTQHHLALATQVNRSAVREYDPQEVALPFLIRAVGADFSPTSELTRHLGDLLFIWGNRFALDPDRLANLGLKPQVLVSTSDQAWSFAWQGGWLPPEIFSPSSFLPGPQPLALSLEGIFPPPELSAEGHASLRPPTPGQPPGQLLLIGSSEMFKDEYLDGAGFDHAQFLLNAVARAAYGPALAALQARHPSPRGFALLDPGAKAFWRAFTLGAGPLLLLLAGLDRYRRRRRPLRLAR
ncbi:MAG: Gldg family protein, partial [Candidatus Latescibacteria bacterium]|nr:Gldg family protein [Candidatus Latescibacterota bacterium]